MLNFKKLLFIVLFVLLLQLSSVFALVGLDFIIYDNFNTYLFVNMTLFPIFNYSMTLYGFILLFISIKLSDLTLYIYSYKISTKITWYKFFRDREKNQHKHNVEDWNKYKLHFDKK